MATFAERLRELRGERNLTQVQVAEKLGITQVALSNMEVGARKPSFDMLLRLAKFFNCTVGYLAGVEDI